MKRCPLLFLFLLCVAPVVRAVSPLLGAFNSLPARDSAAIQTAVENLLRQSNDPAVILQAAEILRTRCVDPQINTLEYWGRDDQTRAILRPAAETFLKLSQRAQTLAQSQADSIAATMQNAEDSSQLTQWTQFNNLVQSARQSQAIARYAQLLAAESEGRSSIAQQAIAAVNAAKFSASMSQLYLAKIALAADKTADAVNQFDAVMNDPSASVADQYQARYFLCSCDLLARNFENAKHHLSELLVWQSQHLRGENAGAQSGAAAAAAILEYRIYATQASTANSSAEKGQFNESALAALRELIKIHPTLKDAALQHLGYQYAGDHDLTQADPLVLEALMQHVADSHAEQQAFNLGGLAAEQILKRSAEFDSATLDFAAALRAAVFDRNGQSAAAAQAYLFLAGRIEQRNLKTAVEALNRAIELFQQLPTAQR
ncbi:MAG TPA: hypothetical protein VGG19_15985, partial [Tepidisphaeraceae bacterium]